jgi:membrane associated rhomboid family serine protease
MTAPEGDVREYAIDRGRALRFAGFAILMATLCGLDVVVVKTLAQSTRAVLAFGVVFFGLVAVLIGRSLFSRSPGLVISDSGLRLPRFANEAIAWTSIVAMNRVKFGRSDALVLKLDPAVAATLTRRGLARIVPRSANASVVLTRLRGPPDAIAAECEARWRSAHAASAAQGRIIRPPPDAVIQTHRPWLTYALLALLAIVFACELSFAVGASHAGSPSVLTLAYMGGNIGNRIWHNGEWWRLFTAAFLHAGPAHIALNGVVLWMAGTALERLVGWRWLGAIFAVSALAGSVASLLADPPAIVSVGASGGIIGLLGALFVIAYRLPPGAARSRLQMRAALTVAPALLPIVLADKGVTIDYAAHGGGVFAGTLLALILLKNWPSGQARPPLEFVAAAVGGCYLAIAAAALVPILQLRAGLHGG